MFKLLLILVSLSFSINAKAMNVISSNAQELKMVRVTLNPDNTFTFESCQRNNVESFAVNQCSLIGAQQKYTQRELSDKRLGLIAKGFGLGVLDAGIIAGIAVGGAYAGAAVGVLAGSGSYTAMMVFGGLGQYGGALAGGAVGTHVVLIDKLSPLKRFRAAKLLKSVLLSPAGNVVVDDINAYVRQLEWILN